MNHDVIQKMLGDATKFPGPQSLQYDVDFEKFTQLVVEKCCEIVESTKPGVEQLPVDVALHMAQKNIKAYFGVSE